MQEQKQKQTSKPKGPPANVVKAVNRIRMGLGKVHQKMVPPQVAMFEMIAGMWRSQAISVAARLGVADVIKNGEMHYEAIAKQVGAHPESLYRLLRALSSDEIFIETKEGYFKLSAYGQCLREDSPGSVKAMAVFQGQYQWLHWGELHHSVVTGETTLEKTRGMGLFDFMAKTPGAQTSFDQFMTIVSKIETESILTAFDFSRFRTLADVGGGHGFFLSSILRAYPRLKGILFDQPHVVKGSSEQLRGLEDRCEVVGGSFFEEIPEGADAYMMKHIIHDWEESLCLKILKNVRTKIPSNGTLLLFETVVTPPREAHFSKLLDLEMLVAVGGKERTEKQYAELLGKAGFRLKRVVPTIGVVSVIEAAPI